MPLRLQERMTHFHRCPKWKEHGKLWVKNCEWSIFIIYISTYMHQYIHKRWFWARRRLFCAFSYVNVCLRFAHSYMFSSRHSAFSTPRAHKAAHVEAEAVQSRPWQGHVIARKCVGSSEEIKVIALKWNCFNIGIPACWKQSDYDDFKHKTRSENTHKRTCMNMTCFTSTHLRRKITHRPFECILYSCSKPFSSCSFSIFPFSLKKRKLKKKPGSGLLRWRGQMLRLWCSA